MKKIVIALFLSLCPLVSLGYAQGAREIHTLKEITIVGMMDYGKTLYERKNYAEAIRVLKRVLVYEPCQMEARGYLKQISSKGIKVTIPPMPECKPQPKHIVVQPAEPKNPNVSNAKAKSTEQTTQRDTNFSSNKKFFLDSTPLPPVPSVPYVAPLTTTDYQATSYSMPSLHMSEDLAQLQQDLARMRQSLHEQTLKLNALEQQLP